MIESSFRKLLLGAGIAAALTHISPPAPAGAASGDPGRINRTTSLRSCGDTRCGGLLNVPSGATVPVRCWRDAGSDLGTNRWFRVSYGGATGFVSANAMSQQPQVPYCSDLQPGDTLFANHSVYSADGRFRLIMQGDGNLVEYGPGGAWWSAMTTGTTGARFVLQGDGNGVIYNGANQAVWANMTMNNGAWINVQNDGNIVTYVGSTPLYATSQHRTFGQMRPVGSANPGAAGNCTWWVEEQIKSYMRRNAYPAWGGNAGWWDNNAPASGWPVQSMPTSHSVVVFEPNTNGASTLGHVAWSDAVQARSDGVWIHITEMNWTGFNRVSSRWVRHSTGMSYIPAPSL